MVVVDVDVVVEVDEVEEVVVEDVVVVVVPQPTLTTSQVERPSWRGSRQSQLGPQ